MCRGAQVIDTRPPALAVRYFQRGRNRLLHMAQATATSPRRLGTPGRKPRNPARPRQQAPTVVQPSSPSPRPVLWYLPLALLTTLVVIVLPALLVADLAPRGGLLRAALAVAAAMALSIALQSLAAALWKRRPQSRDVVFADLMLWGWMRRYWAERHVSQLQDLVESAGTGRSSVSASHCDFATPRAATRSAIDDGHAHPNAAPPPGRRGSHSPDSIHPSRHASAHYDAVDRSAYRRRLRLDRARR